MHTRFQSETLDSGWKADLEKADSGGGGGGGGVPGKREEMLNFPTCGEAGWVEMPPSHRPGNLAPLRNLLCDATFATLETHPCIRPLVPTKSEN